MKVDELEALVAGMDFQDDLLEPADVTLSIVKGHRFPVPDCEDCEGRCCPQQLGLNLFDIARFMDNGLDKFIEGAFQSHGAGIPHVAHVAGSTYCRFLDEDRDLCNIYEVRLSLCCAFPLGLIKYRGKNASIKWFGRHCKIRSDEASFWKLVGNAVQNWNEGVKTQTLLMNAQDQLRKLGFGKYLGDGR